MLFDQNRSKRRIIINQCKSLTCYLFLLASSPTFAMETTGPYSREETQQEEMLVGQKNDEKPLDEQALEVVDGVHQSLSGQLISASNYLDNFFSDKRMEDEGSKSKVVFSYLAGYDDFRGVSSIYSVTAQLHFPKTQRRLRLVIDGSEDETSEANVDSSEEAGSENRFEELKAALQYVFVKSKFWQISARTGLRFTVPVDPFAKLRVRRLFFVEGLTLRLTQSVFLYKSDGWGETSAFDIEKRLDDTYFFRSSSRLTAIRDTGERSFLQTWSIFQDIGEKKILVYSLGGSADLNSPPSTLLYYLKARFRHNFYKKWAFYELIPILSFDRGNSFEASPGFFIKLDVVFG